MYKYKFKNILLFLLYGFISLIVGFIVSILFINIDDFFENHQLSFIWTAIKIIILIIVILIAGKKRKNKK